MNNSNTTAFKLPLYWLFELSLPKEFLTDIAIYFVNHLLKNNGFANQKLKPHLDKTIGINLGSNFANLIFRLQVIAFSNAEQTRLNSVFLMYCFCISLHTSYLFHQSIHNIYFLSFPLLA